jgi:hypothetical protein
MRTRLIAPWLMAVALCSIAAAQPQNSNALTIVGLDGNKLTLSIDQLRQMPQQTVIMNNPHTKSAEQYEGVLLRDVLAKVAAPAGDKLRGDEMRDYVEVTGRDGYSAVFALAEIDPAFQDNKVLVAISSGGKPLDDKQGPVRVVAPQDKRPARSVRMVETITVRRAP